MIIDLLLLIFLLAVCLALLVKIVWNFFTCIKCIFIARDLGGGRSNVSLMTVFDVSALIVISLLMFFTSVGARISYGLDAGVFVIIFTAALLVFVSYSPLLFFIMWNRRRSD